MQIRLSVEVPPAISQECYGEVLDEFSKKAKVFFSMHSFKGSTLLPDE